MQITLVIFKTVKFSVFAIALMAVASCQQSGDWASIDYWEYGFEEEPCPNTDAPFERLCELSVSLEEAARIKRLLDSADNGRAYLSEFHNSQLVLASYAPQKNSFICCEIQAPFRSVRVGNRRLSIAKFGVPEDMLLKIELLNDVDLHGSQYITHQPSKYQRAFLGIESIDKPLVNELNLVGFERTINIYENQPDESPSFIVYLQDGEKVETLARTFDVFQFAQAFSFPAFALVGVESATDVDKRNDEYLKSMTKDEAAYEQYRLDFRNTIVPEVESRLQFQGTNENRVLWGASSGGKWVLDYALDFPEFACEIISLSPAGHQLTDSIPNAASTSCLRFSIGVGKYEGESFVRDAAENAKILRSKGYEVIYSIEPSGHSQMSWAPATLRFVEAVLVGEE